MEEVFQTPSEVEEEASRQPEVEAEDHRVVPMVHMVEERPEDILGRRQEGRPEEGRPDQGRREDSRQEGRPEGGHQQVQEEIHKVEAEDHQAGQEVGRRLRRPA